MSDGSGTGGTPGSPTHLLPAASSLVFLGLCFSSAKWGDEHSVCGDWYEGPSTVCLWLGREEKLPVLSGPVRPLRAA